MSKQTNKTGTFRLKEIISFVLAYSLMLQFFILSAPQTVKAEPLQTVLPVTPIVECVQNSGNGNFTAWFGYNNPNANSVSIPVGAAQNKFTPAPFDRGQTTQFSAGRQRYAFSVDYPSNGKFIWHLNRKTATASSVYPTICQAVEVEISSHTDNQIVSTPTVNLRGKAYNLLPSSSIAGVFVNNSNATYNSSTKEWNLNSFALSEGNNVINVRAVDNAGNEATSTITIVYQNTTPSISSVAVNRGTQGQTLQVTINGRNTNWLQGQTRASFGGEIAVGSSVESELGLVTVLNQTTATAEIVINPKAALAPRNVRVVTNSEDLISVNAFTVLPVSPTGIATNNVTTIAGSAGQNGFADGIGSIARFDGLSGITVGNDDAVYVADAGNNRIRAVRKQVGGNWSTQTLAGDGTAGFQDGQGNQAKFNNPNGVAISADGTVFVADSGNHSIRKILADGTVSTFAGNGVAGFADGQGNAASFNNPNGIAVDNSGNLYVADTGNSAVRKIDSGGNVVTLAGDGTIGSNDSPNAGFNGLAGVTVDGSNVYVYIADGANHTIRRLDSSNAVLTIAGSSRGFADGNATDSRFANPTGITVDGGGRLIISDTVNSLIRAVSTNSEVSTIAGAGEYGSTDGAGNIAKFRLPKGVAISRSSAIFVADSGNQTLRRIGLPPRILSFSPTNGRIGDSVTIFGENFDGSSTLNNTVTFAKLGGGTIQATVSNATRSQLSVIVPAEAITGKITVTTQDGTSESLTNFTVEQNPSPVITDFTPRRGQVGTSVKIIGTNLKTGNTNPNVTFAGSNNARLNALVNSATATEVTVLVPNGAITGFIELTSAWGTTQTSQQFVIDETQQFQLVVSPASVQAIERTHGTAIVSITSSNSTFTQLAKLSAVNLPSGVTATFNPPQITSGGTSTLTLNLANSAISSGTYQFIVRGIASIDGHEVSQDTNASLSVSAAGQTTLSGRVLNTDSEPVIGATVSLDGQTATTDSSGSFLISGVTAGTARPLQIDGRTASSPNRTYPVITEPANIVAGQANEVPYIFYLPAIDIQNEVTIIPGQTTVVETPKVPGVSVTIPANANLRNRDGSPVTRVSITQVPIDRTPTPLPSDVTTGMVFTIQPGGAISDVPMPITFPNTLEAEPLKRVTLYAFDHDTVQWYVYGYGTVSLDGKIIESEINPSTGNLYGITNFSWFMSDTGPDGNPGGGPGSGGGPGGGNGDPCGNSSRGNNPVDFSTGMKMESNTDIGFSGSRGGVALSRTYTSELGSKSIIGQFGKGTKGSYDFQLTATVGVDRHGNETGSAFLLTPEDTQGRIFSYAGHDSTGNIYFKSGATMQFQGDVIVKTPGGLVNFRRADGSTLNFVSDGFSTNGFKLNNISDRNGNTTQITYSGSKISQITDAVGRSINLSYNSDGFISSATDPKGRVWIYGYDLQKRLIAVTEPFGRTTSYVYDQNNLLTEILDPNNNLVKKITYSPQRRVIREEFSDGGSETYTYEVAGSLVVRTEVTSPQGRKISKRFNGSGYVIETVDPLGQVSKIERDYRNFPTKNTGAAGCVESRTFDDRGNSTTITDKLGQTVEVTYEPQFNNITGVKDKLGRITTMTYDGNGNMTSYKDAKNNTLQTFYDIYGRATEVRNSLAQSTRFEYDVYGNISAIVDRSGARWTYEYNVIGNQTSSTDPLGRRTTNVFDTANRLISKTDSSGATTTFSYDTNSNLIKVTNQLGREWTMKYDSSNRLTRTIDPLNRTTRLVYDVDGDLISAKSPSGRTVRYQYDPRGQVLNSTDPSGKKTHYSYDYRGNLVSMTDKRGFATSFVYDELDRLITTRNPLGETMSSKYNAASKMSESTDSLGRRTTYIYDELDRATTINYPDAQVNYTFDDLSRLTQVNDSMNGSIAWAFDARDMVTSETTANGTVSYTYNAAGQRESLSVPNALPVSYGYDTAGRLGSINQGSETFSYGYDALSRLTNLSRPNGVNTTFNYDIVNRLERMKHAGTSQTLEDYNFEYNDEDEIRSVTTLNSAHLAPAAKTASAADGANRVAQFGDADYTFDARGQNTSKTNPQGSTQYNWDTRGRLAGAVLPDGRTVGYSYDALGRKASTTVNGAVTKYLYDGLDVVQDQANGNTTDYLNGLGIDDKLRMHSQTTGDLYFLQDHLGSTQGLTNSAGSVVEWQKYTPYGESNVPNSLTRYGYAGREKDNLTGLIFNRARWYDPARGRFISEDPKGLSAGNNLYEYTGGNPLSRRDPMGMDWRDTLEQINQARWRAEQAVINTLAKPIEFVVGFGDTASGGLTRYARQWQGIDDPSLDCSGWYSAGGWTAVAVEVVMGGEALIKAGGKFALKRALKKEASTLAEEGLSVAKNCIKCFEAGTEVATDKGLKAIEDIKAGDKVLSYNEQSGALEYQFVTQTFTRLADDVWSLKVEGEAKPLGVTSEHPFYIRRKNHREWLQTSQLRAGDEIRLASGRWAKVIFVRPKGEARVYNFTVENNHNYFVGNLRLLTHNAGCGPLLDDLSKAAGEIDKGGLTKAGRSLDKHGAGARPGNSAFPKATGNVAEKNNLAQNLVDDILTDPGTTVTNSYRGRFGNTIEYTAPSSRGVVYDSSGKFLFFKE